MNNIITSYRRLSLIAWYKENFEEDFFSSLKLQKFLFFYELYSKTSDRDYSLDYLKGYRNGPVFSEVYGDYTYRKSELIDKVEKVAVKFEDSADENNAKKAGFLASILTEEDLSEITHKFDLWKSKENLIMDPSQKQVPLKEGDFSSKDEYLIDKYKNLYDVDEIESTKTIKINDNVFLLSKEDYENLTDTHKSTLELISAVSDDLMNPIYVEIGEEGELIVD
ncbi:hypothetical protein ACEN4K_03880 [Marinilactibacillus psychrotolerans]|uniref:hypothetical protein n=1 Tax=Marinilactibacillus psychrotolerans TaxID=191770 RepID=UPI00388AF88A